MKIREGISVTRISLDGHDLPIPEGFSEFLLRSGYWVSGQVETFNNEEILSNYEREVVEENGKLCTTLTYKGASKRAN
ncbi:hypothetical protein JDS99_26180 [Bacillus cereus group sp. N6]|uniref:hypothetical protein n=1 Tax=Bacillus cereus group sp. N6 TaxID=2794583 RepID=UPI0018F39B4E|nr:hypothetical protein [Bacillus cereus group sp. N6]MBJ8113069.1 hypothetical protein [Bacillus cereus group sp. N6]